MTSRNDPRGYVSNYQPSYEATAGRAGHFFFGAFKISFIIAKIVESGYFYRGTKTQSRTVYNKEIKISIKSLQKTFTTLEPMQSYNSDV